MQPCQFMTIRDVAQELGVERHTAGRYVRQMSCVTLGRIKRVRRSAFEEWLREHTQVCAPEKRQQKPRQYTACDSSLFEADGRLKRRR